MMTLIIIGICVIPVVLNVLFVYVYFKQKYKGQSVTIEDFTRYWDDQCIPSPLVIFPPFSLAFTLGAILWIILYPVRVLILALYESIKHKKI